MKESTVTRLLLVFAAALVTMNVVACNATEGAGKDIQDAGSGIEHAADRNK